MTIASVIWLVQAVVFLSPAEGAVKKTTAKKTQTAAKAPAKPQSSSKKAAVPARKGSVANATSASAASSSKSGSAKKSYAKAPVVQRQRQPSQERYQEIQKALAEKGYYQGSVNGSWGPESTEALKRFQRDQKLVDDGKLSSKSIIALGLGPQRAAPAPEKEQ